MKARPLDRSHPDYAASVRELQTALGKFLPGLEHDYDAAMLTHDQIIREMNIRATAPVRRTEAEKDLERFAKFVRTYRGGDAPYWRNIRRKKLDAMLAEDANAARLLAESSEQVPVGREARIISYEYALLEFHELLRELDQQGLRDAVIDAYVQDAMAGIADLPEAGNTNWPGVIAVALLGQHWEDHTGERLPTSLNEATPLAGYFRAGFDFLGIGGNERAAFRRWAELGGFGD